MRWWNKRARLPLSTYLRLTGQYRNQTNKQRNTFQKQTTENYAGSSPVTVPPAIQGWLQESYVNKLQTRLLVQFPPLSPCGQLNQICPRNPNSQVRFHSKWILIFFPAMWLHPPESEEWLLKFACNNTGSQREGLYRPMWLSFATNMAG